MPFFKFKLEASLVDVEGEVTLEAASIEDARRDLDKRLDESDDTFDEVDFEVLETPDEISRDEGVQLDGLEAANAERHAKARTEIMAKIEAYRARKDGPQ